MTMEAMSAGRGLLSILVHLAGSKFAITPAKNVGILKFLYALTALELGFMMICARSLYSIPVKS